MLLAAAHRTLDAQQPATTRLPPLLSLEFWAEDLWLTLTDRDGSYFGRLAEQGTLQRFGLLMDHEYELDLRTGLFTDDDNARWAGAQRGLRVAVASIDHPFILNVADWRERVEITDRVQFAARYRRQHTLTARRDYPTVGVRWSPARAPAWTLGLGAGLHFLKASADVELSANRIWARSRDTIRLDVRLAVLDAFNNVIFGALGVKEGLTPAHFRFDRQPVAARIGARWSTDVFRTELHAGASNRSAIEVSFPDSHEPTYDLEEQVGFVGILADWAPAAGVRLAVSGTAARAATDRRFEPGSGVGFRLHERTHTLGVRGAATIRGPLVVEFGAERVTRPEDRDRDDGTKVRHRDTETFALVALVRRPPEGTTFRLGFALDDRAAGELAPWLTAVNKRLPVEYGYRFSRGFEFAAGVRWDLDETLPDGFDGGHLRFGFSR